jgi:hypothetical protein
MKLINFPKQLNISEDTSQSLREIADAVDSGEVTQIVLACVRNDEYEIRQFSSLTDSVVLSSILHDTIVRGFRK